MLLESWNLNMKTGGEGEAEGKGEEKCNSVIQTAASHFGSEISRIAVAQICNSVGFEGFNKSALESLSDIAIRCISDLGKTSKFIANLAGRTECNVFDVVQGLEDLGLQQRHSNDSGIRTGCVIGSSAVRELKEFVETAEEVPFAQPLPRFPVIREPRTIPSFLQMDETPSSKHIPDWLPAFPDPHTYIKTPVWNERVSDPRTDKIELARQHRKAERSLLNLQQRLLSIESNDESDDGGNWPQIDVTTSPFRAEKEKSSVKLPVKVDAQTEKHVSLLETFAPAIEAMKDGLDSGSDGERAMPKKRTFTYLEFKSGKKVFGEPLDLRIRNRASGRTMAWFGREEEKDDKKRRVEFILRQSLENQQELPQL
ncbi:transcription initiation factor TFIID subunit 8 [Andrographis paniculata]|uniref:transcription initiation factor TFIID subunit 8 n=1 Tax=Andrographis paniculata TaxID=175694 RepID=UPI0021E76661|nr:transcription initiation factor TFIID subunit 8 [Andrographis paniculata]XP_051119837.1 transcription initiation factor TFIID subunit 8 [Andrographis paniculata]XP_051119838.1 transcription initiation factor TFIID subunit 8 [Andrographis paniculata]XP_051119839.1 transcription initiation factor TFIID subunit 8 [Andrographis paniculata]XP_051119840.1 transcription initiation factor TFIID subunit 8 [Andrographis paniculata]XP_051119841.1 transcription initiation factor TFIID subunit 8 [Androg